MVGHQTAAPTIVVAASRGRGAQRHSRLASADGRERPSNPDLKTVNYQPTRTSRRWLDAAEVNHAGRWSTNDRANSDTHDDVLSGPLDTTSEHRPTVTNES